jgi:hypothetical protein
MLSSLPKLADKAFILGFFLPTLMLVLAVAGLLCDRPWTHVVWEAALQKDGWDKLALFVLTVWAFAILLMLLNHIEFQILEGYRWPLSKVPCLRRRERERFEALNRPFETLNEQWILSPDSFSDGQKTEWQRLRRALVTGFPTNPENLLPTRFGNAIRAFEIYSKNVYGADSIPLWLHLSTVIPKEFQAALDDARAQVNCAVNICFFAAIVGFLALARAIMAHDWITLWFSGAAVLAAVISRLAYLLSIQLVYAWGDLVKAAFDCFLPALAEKLGYKLPHSGAQREEFWRAVSEQSIYWRPVIPEQWSSTDKPPPNAEASARNELRKNSIAFFR